VFTEVFTVIKEEWRIVFGILFFIALGQGLASITLKKLFKDQLTAEEYFSLSLAGWLLPVVLISLLWFVLRWMFDPLLNRLIPPSGILVLVAILFRLRPKPEVGSKKIIFFLLLFLFLSVSLRLVFVSRAVFPSYFDSAQHYSLIKNILQNGTALPISSTSYYHPGFHILTAFLVTVLNTDIPRTMLILGQLVLAVMPISGFFLVRHVTGSNGAGIFALILAAFGWYMPAHAVNWGKYPALMSLALLPFILSLAYWLTQNWTEIAQRQKWMLCAILGFSIVATMLLHSRSLIILAIVFLAWIIAAWQRRLSFITRSIIFMMVFTILLLEVFVIHRQAVLAPLLDPYLDDGIWITALILLLSVVALRESSQFVFACLLAVCMLLGSLFVPVKIPGYGVLTLLDRPLVEMILYLPLTLLGGLGLAALEKLLSQFSYSKFLRMKYIQLLLMWPVILHALVAYDWYPSDCCVLVGKNDVAALDWMKNHLPADARIGISVTEMNVLVSDVPEGYSGGDAGIWITPMMDRVTVPLLYSSDFGQAAVKDRLCQKRVSYIYIGELGQAFDSAGLENHPEWYKVLLSRGKVKVYEVVPCR
jgi:hypothetical protein